MIEDNFHLQCDRYGNCYTQDGNFVNDLTVVEFSIIWKNKQSFMQAKKNSSASQFYTLIPMRTRFDKTNNMFPNVNINIQSILLQDNSSIMNQILQFRNKGEWEYFYRAGNANERFIIFLFMALVTQIQPQSISILADPTKY